MTVGLFLFNRGDLASTEGLRVSALLAEQLGYDAVCLEDHIVAPVEASTPYPYHVGGGWTGLAANHFEMLTSIAYIAGITSRIRLMTHVLVAPYRNPVFAAKVLATIDNLSSGRLIVGVGTGWMEDEFRLLGIDTYRRRGQVTTEYLRLFNELWTNPSPTFEGSDVSVANLHFAPRPLQRPRPPIWIGGRSTAAITRAAELGDVWFPTGYRRPAGIQADAGGIEPEDLRRGIDDLRDQATAFGRTPESVEVGLSTDVSFDWGQGSGARPPFVGDAQAILDDFHKYRELGVQHFVITLRCSALGSLLNDVSRFADEILPSLKSDETRRG
jgi:probable F420-dependent oxidoreductase